MKKRRKVKLEWAHSLFGNKFFGAESIEIAFGFRPSIPELPDYWSEETLIRHAELGHILIYNPDQLPDGRPFDFRNWHLGSSGMEVMSSVEYRVAEFEIACCGNISTGGMGR